MHDESQGNVAWPVPVRPTHSARLHMPPTSWKATVTLSHDVAWLAEGCCQACFDHLLVLSHHLLCRENWTQRTCLRARVSTGHQSVQSTSMVRGAPCMRGSVPCLADATEVLQPQAHSKERLTCSHDLLQGPSTTTLSRSGSFTGLRLAGLSLSPTVASR